STAPSPCSALVRRLLAAGGEVVQGLGGAVQPVGDDLQLGLGVAFVQGQHGLGDAELVAGGGAGRGGGGGADDDLAPVLGVAVAGDEPAGFQPVDQYGHRAGGELEPLRDLAGRHGPLDAQERVRLEVGGVEVEAQ